MMKFFDGGVFKIGVKIIEEVEEVVEVVFELGDEGCVYLIYEVVDFIYYLFVMFGLWEISLYDVEVELVKWFGIFGFEEKVLRLED